MGNENLISCALGVELVGIVRQCNKKLEFEIWTKNRGYFIGTDELAFYRKYFDESFLDCFEILEENENTTRFATIFDAVAIAYDSEEIELWTKHGHFIGKFPLDYFYLYFADHDAVMPI
ncbi:MAG: hypothetical protein IJ489_10205 [Clostridia bacterium]|nr:hypothetical protein [Clostridia bacterium]